MKKSSKILYECCIKEPSSGTLHLKTHNNNKNDFDDLSANIGLMEMQI